MEIVHTEASPEKILSAIPSDVQAVYLSPLIQLSDDEIRQLAAGLIQRRLPSFSVFGRSEVELGLLASNTPETDMPRLARRVALNFHRILLGEEAGYLPVTFERGERLLINMATARAIGTYPPFQVLTDAELINEERRDIQRRLTLSAAVREAIAANLDLRAADRDVAAGEQNIRRARSTLLPQADVSSLTTFIDRDRAEASFGSQAQRTLTGSLGVQQLIFSEPAWAGLRIQEHLQTTREEERSQLRLDIAQGAATAYLDVLRAKTLERIEKENLRLTRANLERARIRLNIGLANPAEVFRWESELATDRRAVLDATAQLQLAELALNRLLNRPLEEEFLTAEAGLDDPMLVTSEERLFRFVNDPWSFRVFRDFNVQEGFRNSPELRRFDASIQVQERQLLSARRAFWSPLIALQAGLTGRLAEGGAGTESPLAGTPLSPPRPNDLDWQVAVQASLPLFTSGARSADRDQAEEDLARLQVERRATAERIEQRIRAALELTSSSYPGIGLSDEAAEAAKKNYDLVADAYSRGAVSIIDLLDAQNASLVAEQAAANAVYDFLIDLMEVQRAAGEFDFFRSSADREGWFQRLEAFFQARGVATDQQQDQPHMR
jgi:outer membrane protein TolC